MYGLPERAAGADATFVTLRLAVGDRVETRQTPAVTSTGVPADASGVGAPGGTTHEPVWVWLEPDRETGKPPADPSSGRPLAFLFRNVFDDLAEVTAVVAHQDGLGLDKHALGQVDFTLRNLDKKWEPQPPPKYGPRVCSFNHQHLPLAYPKDSTLPTKLVSKASDADDNSPPDVDDVTMI